MVRSGSDVDDTVPGEGGTSPCRLAGVRRLSHANRLDAGGVSPGRRMGSGGVRGERTVVVRRMLLGDGLYRCRSSSTVDWINGRVLDFTTSLTSNPSLDDCEPPGWLFGVVDSSGTRCVSERPNTFVTFSHTILPPLVPLFQPLLRGSSLSSGRNLRQKDCRPPGDVLLSHMFATSPEASPPTQHNSHARGRFHAGVGCTRPKPRQTPRFLDLIIFIMRERRCSYGTVFPY